MQKYSFRRLMHSNKIPLTFLLMMLMMNIGSFAQVNDGFIDGDFTLNPAWNGNAANFKINSSSQLQLNGTSADTSYLSTVNTSIDNTEWHFWMKLSLSPTTGNNERIYLVADNADLKVSLNGYFLYINGNKNIEFLKQIGATNTLVFTGIPQHVNKSVNTIGIKVTRDNLGTWNIYSDTTGGTNYVTEGPAFFDNSFTSTNYFGIFCQYTASNATKFYFDDFYVGPIIVDTISPSVSLLTVVSNTQLDIQFSENLEQASSENTSNYAVNNSIGNPISALRDAADASLVHLTFLDSFVVSTRYILNIDSINDYAGNMLLTVQEPFGMPDIMDSLEVVINEVLYNPFPGGVDFIELYNRSDKTFEMKGMQLANVGFSNGLINDVKPISSVSKLFYPYEYLVLTADVNIVKSQYYTSNPNGFLQITSMPQFYADSGGVALLNPQLKVMDELQYSDAMQFPLLNDFHGVSLERINPERTTQDKTNWHSAAEGVGFATPGYKNSQFEEAANTDNTLFIEPMVFTPNNDGLNDVVNFHYHFEVGGNMGSILIYDARGRQIRNLVGNELMGVDGVFSWDGINDDAAKALVGIYIIYFEYFDLKGNVNHLKKAFVLG